MKKIRRISVIIFLVLLSACALKPIRSDYTFIRTSIEDVKLDKLGNGKVLIYNGADILHKIDNTARLNVHIFDKALGQLKPKEYVVLDLKTGKYTFKLRHIDLVNMRSEHEVIIDDTTKVIRIEPTITSNKLTITNELPKKFDQFEFINSK